jgi:hypothetical protein
VLALAPDLILEASQLCCGQFGQPPDDLLYHPPPSLIVYADTMFRLAGWVAASWPLRTPGTVLDQASSSLRVVVVPFSDS